MKHTLKTLTCLIVATSLMGACDAYDDSSLWKQIDQSQKQIAELTASLDVVSVEITMLKALATGGSITAITANPTGGYMVSYKDASGEVKTVNIAAASEVVNADIIGMKEDGGVLCWTITVDGKTSFLTDADGAKIPVSGRTPSITVDKDGYWMVNGQYVLDYKGEKVKSSGLKASLITSLTANDDGTVTFTFGDGTTFTAQTSDTLSVTAYIDGVPVKEVYQIPDGISSFTVTYEVKGKLSEGAVVSVGRVDGVRAVLDRASASIAVTVSDPECFTGGGFVITAAATGGSIAVRPVYFSGNSDVEMDNELWTTVDTAHLAKGCTYYAMEFKNITRKMKILEISLGAAVDVTTSYANDCVPNPNGNKNSNNGFCIRETLSQLCARKRTEGQDVLGGINTGFFDSNDGISRGAHIEEGQFAYMPNPKIVQGLPNHAWALTIFKDNTASCAKKEFTGKVKIAGVEKNFYSVNDTILRGRNDSFLNTYPINVYTSRYKQTPHPAYPKLTNILSQNATYIVAKLSGGGLYVNEGWITATVIKVADGATEQPYLTDPDQIAVQIHSSIASQFSSVKVGDEISLKAEMLVGGISKPIYTQNSTMWQFITEGENTVGTIPVDHSFRTLQDPMTFVTVNQKAGRICLIEIDGRQTNWSIGVTADDCAQIALHLGAWNATRFDGGGSSAMWLYRSGTGALVTKPSDSKGERSCLNYIYVRKK